LVNINSRSRNNLSFWSSIIEKGFRKLYYKQYQIFSLSEMVSIVYGVDPEFVPFSNASVIRENFPKVISTLL
jgi:hypothetical protein